MPDALALTSSAGIRSSALSTKPLSTFAPFDDELDEDVGEAVTA
jgi:hypothetical protein